MRLLLAVVAGIAAMAPLAHAQCEPHWSQQFTYDGLDGVVWSMLEFDFDGAGPEPARLVIGGSFKTGIDSQLHTVAWWDGAHWRSIGAEQWPEVKRLVTFDVDGDGPGPERLVAATTSSGVGLVSWYDGTTWQQLGGAAPLGAMATYDEDGDGPQPAKLFISNGVLHRLDNGTWTALGAFGRFALVVYDADGTGPSQAQLCGGGYVTLSPGRWQATVNTWNGTSISELPTRPPNMYAQFLAVHDFDGEGPLPARLVVADRFDDSFGTRVGAIHAFDGATWSPLMEPNRQTVCSGIASLHIGETPELVAMGHIPSAPGSSTNWSIARLHQGTWELIGGWTKSAGDGAPNAATVCSINGTARMVVGGGFINIGDSAARCVGVLENDRFTALGETRSAGFDRPIVSACSAIFDPDGPGERPALLYLGGRFKSAADQAFPFLAAWDGHEFSSPGGAPNGTVNALAVADIGGQRLVASGDFSTIGEEAVGPIASFDGMHWRTEGTDARMATSFASVDHDGIGPAAPVLYAGGVYDLNQPTAHGLRRLVNGVWQPVPGGPTGGSRAICAWDPDGSGPQPETLYVGSSTQPNLWKYDGTLWTQFPSLGTGGGLYTMMVFDPDGPDGEPSRLAVGGAFLFGTYGAALFDGANWLRLGTGGGNVIQTVYGLTAADLGGTRLSLVATGSLLGNYRNIARWDGAAWVGMGTGLNATGATVGKVSTEYGDQVVVIGGFSRVGNDTFSGLDTRALSIAAYGRGPGIGFTRLPQSETADAGSTAIFEAAAASPISYSLRWRKDVTDLQDGPTGTGSTIAGATTGTLTISSISGADAGEYALTVTTACGISVSPAALLVVAPACVTDANRDGGADNLDVIYLASVIAGGPNPARCDPDFNNDGGADNADVVDLADAIASGGC